MSGIAKRLDEFAERQGIVSAEFCKLVDRVENLDSDYKTMGKSLAKKAREKMKLESENVALRKGFDLRGERLEELHSDLVDQGIEIAELKAALSHINDLAPAMHQYTDIEYGMVMKAREALKGE